MINMLYWFIEAQTYSGMPRGALHSNSNTSSEQKEIIDIVCITTIGKFIRDLLPMKSPMELKDNFNVFDLIMPV